MKKITLFLMFFLININSLFAQGIQEKTAVVSGRGQTEIEAIQTALVSAVAQIKGLSLKSEEMLKMRDEIKDNDTKSKSDYQSHIKTFTKGLVSSYEIVSSTKNANGLFEVKIKALIPVYEAGPQINRLRLALAPLRISAKVSDKQSAISYADNWTNSLEESLVQSRRFAMLDRSYADTVNQELNSYKDESFHTSELARLGQKIGTDYLIVGEVKKYNVTDKSVANPLDDTKITRTALNTEISMRIIDVATGQIKFAKTYGSTNSALVDIINAIYPISILSVDTNTVTLGSGGGDLKIGRQYRVMSLGQDLKDPYTGESLGRQETQIGIIEIQDVQFKTSQAKIISGNQKITESFAQGLIIRPIANVQPTNSQTGTKKTKASKSKDSDEDW